MSFKTAVLKNFANFTGKSQCCNLFFINLQAFRPGKKKDSNTVVSFKIWENFKNTFFYRTLPIGASTKINQIS